MPTYEQRISTIRLAISAVLDELTLLRDGDYSGPDPTDRQQEAVDAGTRSLTEARRRLAPATHRLHG